MLFFDVRYKELVIDYSLDLVLNILKYYVTLYYWSHFFIMDASVSFDAIKLIIHLSIYICH